jgi:mannosyl-3-phosphoglycerate phosphatase
MPPLNGNPTKAVVFTDLDGTLLNEKYEYTETQPVVEQLLALNVPVVLCSSKTSAEIQHFQEALNLRDPFISENGAAIFIPEKYFSQDFSYSRQTAGFKVIEFGTGYERLRQTLEKVRADSGAEVVGFGDLSAEEVAEECGLSPQMARLAKKREYDEPFRIVKGDSTRVVRMMEKAGLSVTKGDRYYHLTEDNNKGKAVALLTQLYKKAFGHVWTFGVGNGPNDFEMLRVVDKPFFVQQTDRLQDVWVEILREVRRLNLQAQD